MRDTKRDLTVSQFQKLYPRFANNGVYRWLRERKLSYKDGGTVVVMVPEVEKYLSGKSTASTVKIKKTRLPAAARKIMKENILRCQMRKLKEETQKANERT